MALKMNKEKNNRLIYEGEDLKVERHGKGKLYFSDYPEYTRNIGKKSFLKYEGDFLNGEKNGNGKST